MALTSLYRQGSEVIQILLREPTPHPVPSQSPVAGIPALRFLSSYLTSAWSLRGAAESCPSGTGKCILTPCDSSDVILSDAFSGCSLQRNPAGQGCVCLRNPSAARCEGLGSPPLSLWLVSPVPMWLQCWQLLLPDLNLTLIFSIEDCFLNRYQVEASSFVSDMSS